MKYNWCLYKKQYPTGNTTNNTIHHDNKAILIVFSHFTNKFCPETPNMSRRMQCVLENSNTSHSCLPGYEVITAVDYENYLLGKEYLASDSVDGNIEVNSHICEDEEEENPDEDGENPDEDGENPDEDGENPDEEEENPDEEEENDSHAGNSGVSDGSLFLPIDMEEYDDSNDDASYNPDLTHPKSARTMCATKRAREKDLHRLPTHRLMLRDEDGNLSPTVSTIQPPTQRCPKKVWL